MKNNQIFSIIVPVYNVEKYLETCIQSVLQQVYTSYELILVDDGSTDSSRLICDRYAEKWPDKIHVIHKENGGPSSARNTGISAASGEYVLFLDSDDYYLDENVLLKLKEICQGQDIVAFEWKEIVNGAVNSQSKIELIKAPEAGQYNGKNYLKALLTIHPGIPWYSWMYAYKYAYIQEKSLKFLEGKTYEDVLLTPTAVLYASSVGILNYPVYGYRIGRESSITSTTSFKNLNDHLYASDYNTKLVNSMDLDSDLREKILSNFAEGYFSVMINVFALSSKIDQKNIIQQLEHYRYMAQYAKGNKQKFARMLMNTFGMMTAIRVLNARRVIKGMIKK